VLRILLYACKNAGRPELALSIGERVAAMTSNAHQSLGIRAFAYAQEGEREKAEAILAEMAKMSKHDTASGYYKALTHALLGQYEDALLWLEAAFSSGIGITAVINPEPVFDPLRSEPRFQAMIGKLGLC
jgi:tetratricopeptide (TPR) repeat protein